MEHRTDRKKQPPLWKLLLEQLLLTALVLCVFALFHHVIPDWNVRREGIGAPLGAVERKEQPPEPGAPAQQEGTDGETTPEPLPDTWEVRFAEHFSAEPVWEENSYRSPHISEPDLLCGGYLCGGYRMPPGGLPRKFDL